MAIAAGKQMRVFIETSEGTLYNLDGMATSISVTDSVERIDARSYDNPHNLLVGMRSVEFDIHGVCTGDMFTTDEVNAMRTAREWKCTYCGRPNKRERETCQSCGAVRSFLYG